MKQNLYCMFDRLAETYGPPQVGRSDVLVARMFVQSMDNYCKQQKEKGVEILPSDFQLVKIGSFDDETGRLSPLTQPEIVSLNGSKEKASGV